MLIEHVLKFCYLWSDFIFFSCNNSQNYFQNYFVDKQPEFKPYMCLLGT